MSVIVSEHALKRAKQRCGISRKSVQDLAQRAWDEGLERRQATGELRRYLDKVRDEDGRSNFDNGVDTVFVYWNYTWIFAGHKLVTVYLLPQHVRGAADSQRKKMKSEAN